MSAEILPGDVCTSLVATLEEIANGAHPSYKRTKVGFLDSLRSSVNMVGMDIEIDQGNGQTRDVDIYYMPRRVKDDVSRTRPADCETSDERGYSKETVEISLYASIEETFRESYIKELCEGKREFFAKLLQTSFNAMAESVNEQLIEQVDLSGFGVNITTGSSARRDVTLLDAADDEALLKANFTQWFDTELDDDNKFHAPPIIAGQGVFSRMNMYKGFACCNDAGDMVGDLIANAGYAFFKDQMMNSALGANELIVYEPGTMQFLGYNKYRDIAPSVFTNNGAYGGFQAADGTFKGLVVDPMTGIVYDVYLAPNHCDNTWYFRMEKEFDIWTMPVDVLDATDELYGSNGILHYRGVSA